MTDRALAAQTFGFSGTLERSIEECATNSDIIAFRMGASPMVLTGVGLDTTAGMTTPGFSITFNGDVTITAPTDYQIWYKAGVLVVWNAGTLINDQVPLLRRNTYIPRAGEDPFDQDGLKRHAQK